MSICPNDEVDEVVEGLISVINDRDDDNEDKLAEDRISNSATLSDEIIDLLCDKE
jgi:hypothetical protein